MAVNYMDRLAALRGDRQHAAGAHGRVSAPVLHADEHRRKHKKKRKLSRKQKAALAKGQRKLRAMHRAARRRAREEAGRKSMSKKRRHKRGHKRSHKRRAHEAGEKKPRVYRGKKAIARRKKYLARKKREGKARVVLHGKAARRYAKRHHKKGAKRIKKVVLHGRSAAKYMRSHKKRKHPKKRKHAMARKSSKRSRAAKKAARTRKHNKEMRRAAARRAARARKRHGHKRSGHKRRGHSRRAAPRRRKRGGHARRRYRGLVRRSNRSGKFVGKGGRIHGRKRRGGYHRAGRIVREGYSMENPLGMSELATGLVTGLVGYLAADITDRYLAAGRPPLGGTLYAEASPIYSDYVRLGVGVLMGALPLVGAHFIDGAKHAHIRAGLQFFGFGAGIRTLGHLVSDLISSKLKNNSMVGSTVQALYPHEIVSQGQLAGVQAAVAKQGAGALPEHVAAEVAGMGAIPEGLGACCNTSSRMLNTALSPLQPIGRNMDGGGAANPPPPVALPPPIERIVQQPYSPPSTMRQATPMPMSPPALAPQPQPTLPQPAPPARAATVPAATVVPAATPMVAAFAPAVPPAAGVRGLPSSPFAWSEEG